VILWEELGTNTWKLLISAALQMWMLSSGSGHVHTNQKIVTVIIRKSQSCAQYLCGIMHKTCFFIKLNRLALKNDSNHCGSEMLGKGINNQHSCRPLASKGVDGTFKCWYFAGHTVHLIVVQKG